MTIFQLYQLCMCIKIVALRAILPLNRTCHSMFPYVHSCILKNVSSHLDSVVQLSLVLKNQLSCAVPSSGGGPDHTQVCYRSIVNSSELMANMTVVDRDVSVTVD